MILCRSRESAVVGKEDQHETRAGRGLGFLKIRSELSCQHVIAGLVGGLVRLKGMMVTLSFVAPAASGSAWSCVAVMS